MPLIVLLMIVNVPSLADTPTFMVNTCLKKMLPLTVLLIIVNVPAFQMPAPRADENQNHQQDRCY